ncbi:MAG: hypothetical protein ACRETN_00370 [Nevskiales bacterium]
MTSAENENDDDVWVIDDPRVPEEVREHGALFDKPACAVILHGRDYWLFAEDGELLDIVSLK